MKILLLNGSPRISGNTKTILDLFQKEFEHNRKAVCEIVNLSQMEIHYCKGCRICFNQSESNCPNKDDLQKLKNKMDEADIIIAGSPVYVEDVSGQMKTWIDRMAFCSHRPFLLGKPVFVFSCSGAGASKGAVKSMKNAFVSWGATVVGYDNYSMGTKMEKFKAEETFGQIVRKNTYKILHKTEKNNIPLFSLIAFQVQKKFWNLEKNQIHEFDYQYWKKNGWLEKDRIYYNKEQLSMGKRLLVVIASSFVASFMIRK